MDREKRQETDLMRPFEAADMTDRAAMLDAIAPITDDSIDEELQAAHYSANRTNNRVIAALCILLGLSVAGNVAQSMRPPQFKLVAVDSLGRAVSASNPEGLVPTAPMAKTFLTYFAMDRYERLKGTITTKFPLQYLYMYGPVADEVKARDTHDAIMANVLSGKAPENKLRVFPPQILSFSKQKFGNKALWAGLAAIELEKSFPAKGLNKAHTENWTIGVKFVMNPDQVPEKSLANPLYETVNPAGLTIVEPPSENHNPRPEEQ